MHELANRIGLALLVLAGVATLSTVVELPSHEVADVALVRHWQVLVGFLGAALFLAAVWPALRLPAITAALLSKTSLVAVSLTSPGASELTGEAVGEELVLMLLLAAAGAIFIAQARREARWDGVLPLHQES